MPPNAGIPWTGCATWPPATPLHQSSADRRAWRSRWGLPRARRSKLSSIPCSLRGALAVAVQVVPHLYQVITCVFEELLVVDVFYALTEPHAAAVAQGHNAATAVMAISLHFKLFGWLTVSRTRLGHFAPSWPAHTATPRRPKVPLVAAGSRNGFPECSSLFSLSAGKELERHGPVNARVHKCQRHPARGLMPPGWQVRAQDLPHQQHRVAPRSQGQAAGREITQSSHLHTRVREACQNRFFVKRYWRNASSPREICVSSY